MNAVRQEEIRQAVLSLDAWLDTLRGPDGYSGPVVHWWQDSLYYTGAGLDWRYEGIIGGYLNLYQRTGQASWLEKARRAGDDLLRGQLPSGNFRNSGFELNPSTGGTPHEAACDLALLHLAGVLKDEDSPGRQAYLAAAERNMQGFILAVLWDGSRSAFRNTAFDRTFVPNKTATIAEALFAWSAATGDSLILERFARPALQAILESQVRVPGRPLDGAIYQSTNGKKTNARFFPFYIARCLPALVQGHRVFGDQVYFQAAQAAMNFILRCRLPDGSFPQVIYGDGRANCYPQWIAGTGDVLRAMMILQEDGMEIDIQPTLQWLLAGFESNGRVRTARGFASQVSQRAPAGLPEFRGLLGVCGWADKAFRVLSELVTGLPETGPVKTREVEQDCLWRGKRALFLEDERRVELRRGEQGLYRWRKGESWAEVCWV